MPGLNNEICSSFPCSGTTPNVLYPFPRQGSQTHIDTRRQASFTSNLNACRLSRVLDKPCTGDADSVKSPHPLPCACTAR